MIAVEKFKPEHLLTMDVQPIQKEMLDITPDYASRLCAHSDALTITNDGKPIACFGRVTMWERRHIAWAILSKDAGRRMLSVVKAIKRAMAFEEGTGRYEAIIRSDFKAGQVMASILGFKWHHHEEGYLPNGGDAEVYVRFC